MCNVCERSVRVCACVCVTVNGSIAARDWFAESYQSLSVNVQCE